MESNTKMPLRFFYGISLTCAVIIFCESLQLMMRVRNPDHYILWIETFKQHMDYEIYMSLQLSYFFGRVITPILLGLCTYIAFVKVRIGKLFVGIWTLLLGGMLIQTISELDTSSMLYYIKIVGYIGCMIIVLRLLKVIRENQLIEED